MEKRKIWKKPDSTGGPVLLWHNNKTLLQLDMEMTTVDLQQFSKVRNAFQKRQLRNHNIYFIIMNESHHLVTSLELLQTCSPSKIARTFPSCSVAVVPKTEMTLRVISLIKSISYAVNKICIMCEVSLTGECTQCQLGLQTVTKTFLRARPLFTPVKRNAGGRDRNTQLRPLQCLSIRSAVCQHEQSFKTTLFAFPLYWGYKIGIKITLLFA